MSETKLSRFQTLELIFGGIVFSLVNNIATIWNAKTLLENQHQVAGGLTIFFLFFPGLVTSVGFLALYCLGNRRFGKLSPVHVVIAFLSLLSCYPIVPIVL